MNIRFSGFGGQGIVLSGVILGRAAVLEGKNAIQTQSYGSESRGGACRSDVTISDGDIHELESPEVDVLVAMSQQAYERYLPSLKKNGTLIVEKDLVQIPDKAEGQEPMDATTGATYRRQARNNLSVYAISATDIAFKKFGRKIIANMVVLGYMTALLGILSPESLKKAIKEDVPAGTEAVNIEAFEEGCVIGRRGAKG